MADIKLLVGLGNPGAKYQLTRHNAGFWLLDEVAKHLNVAFRVDARYQGQMARYESGGRILNLLKPSTFMNRSGLSVQLLAQYFKITPPEILVAHDELDLPPGVVRLKRGGGHGGHNGLRDVIALLGSAEFARLRLGIGHPGNRSAVVDYVLGSPTGEDETLILGAISKILPELQCLMEGDIETAMRVVNGQG
jgi:PTH1 family peptidyl-tRNA hydrolase